PQLASLRRGEGQARAVEEELGLRLLRRSESHERLDRPRRRGARALVREVGGRLFEENRSQRTRERGVTGRSFGNLYGLSPMTKCTGGCARVREPAQRLDQRAARCAALHVGEREEERLARGLDRERRYQRRLGGGHVAARLVPERDTVEESALRRGRYVRPIREPCGERGRDALPARRLGSGAPLGIGRVGQS